MNIKVAGVGGAGCRAVSHMLVGDLPAVEFISIDTDWAAVRACQTQHKLELPAAPAAGFGSGGKLGWAASSAEARVGELRAALAGADLVLVVAGLGGGTGSGAAPVVARAAREAGALTLGLVTRPLLLESSRRAEVAQEGLSELFAEADSAVVVPCEGLMHMVGGNLSIAQFFGVVDELLLAGVRALVELATRPGLVCLGFADMQAAFRGGGRAALSIGQGTGSHCAAAAAAARAALHSPILDMRLGLAQEVIFQVRGGPDLRVQDVADVRDIVRGALRSDAGMVYNTLVDPAATNSVTVTIFATAFGRSDDAGGSA